MKNVFGRNIVIFLFSATASLTSAFAMQDESSPIERHSQERENRSMLVPNPEPNQLTQFDSELRNLEVQVATLRKHRDAELRSSDRYRRIDSDVKELDGKIANARQSVAQLQAANPDTKDMYRSVVESQLAEIRYSLNKGLAE